MSPCGWFFQRSPESNHSGDEICRPVIELLAILDCRLRAEVPGNTAAAASNLKDQGTGAMLPSLREPASVSTRQIDTPQSNSHE